MERKPQAYELNQEFEAATYSQWRALVESELKGADFEARYHARRTDGLTIEPLYSADHRRALDVEGTPGAFPFLRGSAPTAGWTICAAYDGRGGSGRDEALANEIAADLDRGSGAIWLMDRPSAGGQPIDVPALLARFSDAALTVFVESPANGGPSTDALRSALSGQNRAPDAPSGGASCDPYSETLTLGPESLDTRLDEAVQAVAAARDRPRWSPVVLSSLPYFDAEATAVGEIAYLAASLVDLLRRVDAAGGDAEALARKLVVRVAAGDEVYLEIAKIRALRVIWARVLELCGWAAESAPQLHLVGGRRSLTRIAPHVNLLRQTSVAFIGATAGARWITTIPFDAAIGRPDAFSRRMALNTQLILRDESHLDKVADPAGGSYYIESLTRSLAEAAWRELQALEGGGGIAVALADRSIQRAIAEHRQAVANEIAKRRIPLVGVSEFPQIDEPPYRAATFGAEEGDPHEGDVSPRRAAPFEAFRARSDAHLMAKGRRPTVLIANLGPIPSHKARSTFAENVFWAGGFATVQNDGFADDAALIAAFREVEPDGAVLCSSDAIYAERAVSAARALRQVGAGFIAFAGRPGALEAELRAVPVDAFLFLGCDVVATLTELLELAGVAR
ncbi:MAG: hypothetical protein KC609_23030 [Myxococcales bacterium]|nr:hypothetical protein [Myxococcales bacterium]